MTTFQQLLDQAKVELDSKGVYLAKDFRNCECTGRLLTAVRAMIDARNESETRHEREKAKLAEANSKLAATNADLEKKLREAYKVAVNRGLEGLPEVSAHDRQRVLNVNGE